MRVLAVESLVRPDIAEMEAYTPIVPFEVLSERLGRQPEAIVKLDANENPYGPSPRAREALATLDRAHIYPDPEARALRAALADYVGVDAAHLLVGAGADELIDLVMRLFIAPGDAIVNCPPTFGMYSFDAALNGARVMSSPRREDFTLDLEEIEHAALQGGVKLLFICSPNNPDGSLLPPADLERLLGLPLVVVLDEAYIEFAGVKSAATRVPGTPNLVVLRTFSKWAGLAGLRVGYGVFPLWMMDHLWKIKQPYNLNVAADASARASLADLDWLRGNIARLQVERERLFRALQESPLLEPYPCRANFVLCRVVGVEAGALKAALEAEGVLIRYFDKPGLRDHVRVSVGKPEHTDALLAALARIEKDVM
jgi:histidinol-phosphate aminotransferase